METSCGVVLVNFGSVLLLQYPQGHWGFPKGHFEDDDGAYQQTALRELEEETGISEVRMVEDWRIRTEYTFTRKGRPVLKEVFWFIGETDQYEINLSHEHRNYMWLDWDAAETQLTFEPSKEVLRAARNQLRAMGREV
ncbi:MAG: NUDIX domain-containing protein [Candidatus Thermoplasmatota archaeon]|nr:NUDIX domain-containing protein [Candidatus Thermoplasmatota archaeon]